MLNFNIDLGYMLESPPGVTLKPQEYSYVGREEQRTSPYDQTRAPVYCCRIRRVDASNLHNDRRRAIARLLMRRIDAADGWVDVTVHGISRSGMVQIDIYDIETGESYAKWINDLAQRDTL